MPEIGFVNHRFMPLAEAKVSVEDRGYQFGDGVYEVIRTYKGVPFRLEAHLARLARSAEAIAIELPYAPEEWNRHIKEGIRLAGFRESKVYLQVTRGVAPRDHHVPDDLVPTVVMTVREMSDMDPASREAGVSAITMDDFRWGRCDIKTINLLANVLARRQARAVGAFETIYVSQGNVAEGAVANVMIVKSGVLSTPSEGPRILSGVTRAVVLELARKEGLPVEERRVTLGELYAADEVFLTGTTVEVLPVVRVDDRPTGQAKPGEVSRLLSARFRELVA